MQRLFEHHTSLIYSTYGIEKNSLAVQPMFQYSMGVFNGIQDEFTKRFGATQKLPSLLGSLIF